MPCKSWTYQRSHRTTEQLKNKHSFYAFFLFFSLLSNYSFTKTVARLLLIVFILFTKKLNFPIHWIISTAIDRHFLQKATFLFLSTLKYFSRTLYFLRHYWKTFSKIIKNFCLLSLPGHQSPFALLLLFSFFCLSNKYLFLFCFK